MPFSSLGLSPALMQALSFSTAKDFIALTPIQSATIPAAVEGRDVLGSAQTGSGKTLAFALPILQRLESAPRTAAAQSDKARSPRALILVPTRELAVQVGDVMRELAQHLQGNERGKRALRVTTVFGGVSINPQMMGLRGGTDIVVATPGRLLDLIDHNALALSSVQMLVLDEADRLFDLGFSEELGRILALLPPTRQNLFFSATFPPKVELLAQTLLHDPVRIIIAPKPEFAPVIVQRAILVDAPQRTQLLRHLIEQNTQTWQRVLVFVATQHAAEMVAEKLRKVRINAEPFHGELSQGKRVQVLADFKASRLKVVIATDVASRGLDIAELPVVVNFDLPRSPVDYVHRIGRTGRAGVPGIAVSFVSAATEAHFHLIQKRQGSNLLLEQIEGFEPTQATPQVATNGGIKGKRPSKKDKLRAIAIKEKQP
jgi:ATP-dependent RNA helicase RhlE